MLNWMDKVAVYTRRKVEKFLNPLEETVSPVVFWIALVTVTALFGWVMVYYHWRKYQHNGLVKQDWSIVNTEREYPPPMWKFLVTKDKEVINWIQEGF